MIQFPRQIYDQIIQHAHAGNNEEVCGILGGVFDVDSSVVNSAYPADNAASNPSTRYYIDPEEQLEIIEQIEAEDDTVIGFYHSHPTGPPHPSDTDADCATWPNRSYIIISMNDYPYVGSWRWRGAGEFEQEIITLV